MRHAHRRDRRRAIHVLRLHVLAMRAVPGLAHVLAGMPAVFDARAADVARQSRALVDPHAIGRIEAEARAPLAAAAVQADELSRLCDDVRGADDDARLLLGLPPPFAWAIDVPRAAHLHVRVQHDFMRRVEVDEEMLAVRFDRLHGATHDLIVADRCAHLRRRDLEAGDDLTSEYAPQYRRGAEDRVAFRHGSRIDQALRLR